jgi:hypothetical protein
MRAISAALGKPVKEFDFLFLRAGIAVPVTSNRPANYE